MPELHKIASTPPSYHNKGNNKKSQLDTTKKKKEIMEWPVSCTLPRTSCSKQQWLWLHTCSVEWTTRGLGTMATGAGAGGAGGAGGACGYNEQIRRKKREHFERQSRTVGFQRTTASAWQQRRIWLRCYHL